MEQTGITKYVLKGHTKSENIRLNILGIAETNGNSIVLEGPECEGLCTVGQCEVDGGSGTFKKDKESRVLIQSLRNTTICPENVRPRRKAACMSYSSRDITLYYYQTNMVEELGKGIPVVMNLSNTDQFLKCTLNLDKAKLCFECFEKARLDYITKNDPDTWPFVFYLTSSKDGCRRFESAECSGWFINTNNEVVSMAKTKDNDPEDCSFLFGHSSNEKSK